MALQNPWVTYLDRSYKKIKASIVNRMKVAVPEITDLSESNIFIIIAGLFAGLVEQLNYYIDQVARESFITTARRYSSVIKITRLLDYRVRSRIGSTVDVRITAVDGQGNPVILSSNYTFNSGIIVKTDMGIQFVTQRKATIFAGTSFVVIGARQGQLVQNQVIGTTTSNPNQYFELNPAYRHDSLQITINGQTWEFRKTFAYSGPLDKHFIVQINEGKQIFVLFGNGINGAIPPLGQNILATYYSCAGIEGNVEANTVVIFDTSTSPIPPSGVSKFTVGNDLPAIGGLEIEDIERIRKNAPLSIRTLDRAVTKQDYQDLALLVPGVGKTSVNFNTQLKQISIYVAPDEGGTASSLLLRDVEDYFDDKKIISTYIVALVAGETKIRLSLDVTAKFRRDTTQTRNDIITALNSEFGFNNSKINRSVRISDIIALIDNLDKVDYLSLNRLTTKPYPRITKGLSALESNWVIRINTTSYQKNTWRIAVVDSTTARLYKQEIDGTESADGDIAIQTVAQTNPSYTSKDGSISIAMWGVFSVQDTWVFDSYAYKDDINLTDYTIPIFDVNELDLIVREQLIVQ